MIRTLIIEDEWPAAHRLEKMLKTIDDEIEIVGITDTISGSVEWLTNNQHPDLIMLDIQLGDGYCFSIFKKIKVESYVIFTTAYDEFAIQAFDLNSIGYLLKPIDEKALSNALEKFRKMRGMQKTIDIEALVKAMEEKRERFRKRFAVNIHNRIKIIDIDTVAFFYSLEKSSFMCTYDNKHYPVEYSLDTIETMIDHNLWFRINRGFIVSLKAISGISVISKSRIKITTEPPYNQELVVSGPRTPYFRSWIEK